MNDRVNGHEHAAARAGEQQLKVRMAQAEIQAVCEKYDVKLVAVQLLVDGVMASNEVRILPNGRVRVQVVAVPE